MPFKKESLNVHAKIAVAATAHAVSSDVFCLLSEYEFATFYFDEKTCEIAISHLICSHFSKKV